MFAYIVYDHLHTWFAIQHTLNEHWHRFALFFITLGIAFSRVAIIEIEVRKLHEHSKYAIFSGTVTAMIVIMSQNKYVIQVVNGKGHLGGEKYRPILYI